MEKRKRCISLVEKSRDNGLNGLSKYKLKNGEEIHWLNEIGNQQGQAWECSLRLCQILESYPIEIIKGSKVIELVYI